MQVFVTSTSCIETASQLDRKRLNKQIIEAGQILKAIRGEGKGSLPCYPDVFAPHGMAGALSFIPGVWHEPRELVYCRWQIVEIH